MTSLQQLLFTRHIATHNLSFTTTDEFEFRFLIWQMKDDFVNAHNADPTASYTVAHNKFSTWTNEEYKQRLLGYKQ